MFGEIFLKAWDGLQRHRLRSFLTMLGIGGGIVADALLIDYGSGYRAENLGGIFFGKDIRSVFTCRLFLIGVRTFGSRMVFAGRKQCEL